MTSIVQNYAARKGVVVQTSRLYLIIPLLLLVDTFLLGLFAQPVISTLLCLYAVLLIRNTDARLLLFALLFLSIESLLVNDSVAFSLIFLLPLSIAVLEIKELITHASWLPYTFVLVCTTIESVALPLWMNQMTQSPLFIFFRICATMVVVLIFEKFLITR